MLAVCVFGAHRLEEGSGPFKDPNHYHHLRSYGTYVLSGNAHIEPKLKIIIKKLFCLMQELIGTAELA